MSEVCVDAGLVVKFVSPEDDSPLAETLFAHWRDTGTQMIVPAFGPAEIDSVLRQKVVRGSLSEMVAEESFRLACLLPIEVECKINRQRAWEIAKTFGFSNVYDSVYLALAEARKCEFWTADKPLYDKVKERITFVRFLGS